MATGRLASIDITSAATDTQLYVCPSSKVASFTLSAVNRTASPVQIRVALTTSTSVSNDSYIAYDHTIYPNETYERSGLVLNQGQYVYVRSSATNVNFVAYGYEE